MSPPLVIVGIDPGTTLGYAILDLEGNIIEVNSSKLLDLKSMIKIISDIGLPVIVSTDKKNVPGFVSKLSRKLGARVISPREDMLVAEKKNLVQGFKTRNDHEQDALATAVFAHKKVGPLLKKVEQYIAKHKKHDISDKLKRVMILQNSSMSIQSAVSLIEKPTKKEKAIVKKIIERRDFEKDYLNLYEKSRSLQKDYRLIKKQRDELRRAQSRPRKIVKKYDKDAKESLLFKDRKITSLSKDNRRLKTDIQCLKEKVDDLNRIILEIDRYVVVKLLDNLGMDFELKKKALNLKKGDIVMINDPSIVSRKSVDSLRKLVDVVITHKQSRWLRDFVIVNPKDLNMVQLDSFVLVEKRSLEDKLDKKRLFEQIIEDYKSRSK